MRYQLGTIQPEYQVLHSLIKGIFFEPKNALCGAVYKDVYLEVQIKVIQFDVASCHRTFSL